MNRFLHGWSDAALTTVGFFWMALWAFALGYVISGAIQVFVTERRMQRAMGEAGPKSVGLATLFGFLSSSCSFAALATTRSLLAKGAGFVPAFAFLLASTNLVIELGIVIAVFLSWQFVVGEYLGGLLLIGLMWIVVRLTLSSSLADSIRSRLEGGEDGEVPDWRALIRSRRGWAMVGERYVAEWRMVWKDVTFGFTVAGVIAAFVPASWFQALFVGAGSDDPAWWQVLAQTVIGPVAAFMTFIGSMGNIPLAGVLYGSGVGFAGVMAFIFSDLVVFPVVRMNAVFYGWKAALYIVGVLLACLVGASLILHYGFALLGILPSSGGGGSGGGGGQPDPAARFGVDYTLFLNAAFLIVTGVLVALAWTRPKDEDDEDEDNEDEDNEDEQHEDEQRDDDDGESEGEEGESEGCAAHDEDEDASWMERGLRVLAIASYVWLAGGLVAYAVTRL